MILIEECLRNFSAIQDLRMRTVNASEILEKLEFGHLQTSYELSDLFVDVTTALDKTEFTLREVKVLQLILEGYNYSEIARETGINRLAVPDYFAKICNKLVTTLGDEYSTKLREK